VGHSQERFQPIRVVIDPAVNPLNGGRAQHSWAYATISSAEHSWFQALTVLHTPGHSPDSISLLDEHGGILFPADQFNLGPVLAHFPDSDIHAHARSARRLAVDQRRTYERLVKTLRRMADDALQAGEFRKVKAAHVQQAIRGVFLAAIWAPSMVADAELVDWPSRALRS
jgi:glyoxylase-like metal-dependent hydrolase (beta-lactamase superfamily II)